MAAFGSLLLLLVLTHATLETRGQTVYEFYVSPTGNDLNPGTLTSPFLTPFRAQVAAREAAQSSDEGPVTVFLRTGLYLLNTTLVFDERDSGSPAHSVTWTIYPPDSESGGKAVLSGGQLIDNWTPFENGIYQAKTNLSAIVQLFANNGWQQRARFPNSNGFGRGLVNSTFSYTPISPCSWEKEKHLGVDREVASRSKGGAFEALRAANRALDLNVSGSLLKHDKANSLLLGATCPPVDSWGFVYSGNDMNASWANVEDVEVLVLDCWAATWSPVETIFEDNRTVWFSAPASSPPGSFDNCGTKYIAENMLEGIDLPGEFYYNRHTNTLYYMPPYELDIEDMEIYAPALGTVVSFAGTSSTAKVSNIVFRGISVLHASDEGDRFGYFSSHGVIEVANAEFLTIDSCEVGLGGANGVYVTSGVSDLAILNSFVHDVGGNGISLFAVDSFNVLVNNTFVNNTALLLLSQPAGIYLKGARNITLQFSEISFSPYTGISIGWQTGTSTPQPISDSIFNVQYNHVHDFGLEILSDFGGIFTSSCDNTCFDEETCSTPTRIYRNIIEKGSHSTYGSHGVYVDEQVSSVDMESNLIHHVGDAGAHMHCGANNSLNNNIIIFAAQQLSSPGGYLESCNSGGNPTWPNLPHGFDFYHNIIFVADVTGHEQFTVDTDYRLTYFDENVYYTPNPSLALQFPNLTTWQQWRSEGQDEHSVISDPQFADVANGNYSLLPSSPALSLGFVPWDYSLAGTHGNPFSRVD